VILLPTPNWYHSSGSIGSSYDNMSDLCFFEIISGAARLRTSVTEHMEQLPQSTTWLDGGTPEKIALVQNVVQRVMAIVKDCLNTEPEQRPNAKDLSEKLTDICDELEFPNGR
jgi:hypothetical protein